MAAKLNKKILVYEGGESSRFDDFIIWLNNHPILNQGYAVMHIGITGEN
jgi:hypothetical protein